jgi:PII-like signaling protein
MNLPEEGYLLRIFIGESDKHEGKPLFEWIVIRAREYGLAGATVLRGIMGFGPSSKITTVKILRLSEDLPIVVEIVDTQEKLEGFLDKINGVIQEGLVTIEKAQIKVYRSRKP